MSYYISCIGPTDRLFGAHCTDFEECKVVADSLVKSGDAVSVNVLDSKAESVYEARA